MLTYTWVYLGIFLQICYFISFNMIHMFYRFSSVAQSCPTLYNPMGCTTPGLLVHHQLQEFTQTHVHHIGDAIQPSHPAFRMKWLNDKVSRSFPMNIQDSFPLGWTGWISLHSTGLSSVFSNTTVQNHQFLGTQPSL